MKNCLLKTISIVTPVFNEAESLPFLIERLNKAVELLEDEYKFEYIFIVDKCNDDSFAVLNNFAENDPRIFLIQLSRRFGHQMSLVAGIDQAHGDAIIMMDSDLEHPPELIPEMIKKYEEGFDIVKTTRVYNEQISLPRRLASNAYYSLLNYLTKENLGRNEADFRLITRKVADVFSMTIREHNQYLRGLFSWVGFTQATLAFKSEKRSKGKSKYNLRRLINFGLQGVVSFSTFPLKFSILIGMITAITGIFYGVISSYYRLTNPDYAPAGWATVVFLILFIGGVQLIVLGLIGYYIAAIYDEAKDRPLYIIEKRINYS